MKNILIIIFLILSCFISFGQNGKEQNCQLLQTILEDTLFKKEIFLNKKINKPFIILDTNSVLTVCDQLHINLRNVNLVHFRPTSLDNKDPLLIEIQKITKRSNHYKVYLFYSTRNLWAFFEYIKIKDQFIYHKHHFMFF